MIYFGLKFSDSPKGPPPPILCLEVSDMCARIAVAMSGGVDSSAAALLLREEGHSLIGVTLRLFAPAGGGKDESGDARAVARQLGIPHHVLDCADLFCREVMDRFVAAYEAGRTPNPCIECNRRIKFGALLDKCLELGQEEVATGHYARREYDAGSGRWLLKTALHPEKDQSYVLYALTQEQLSRSRFPLGGLSKDEIRSIAAREGLASAHKSDSQDICFVPDGDYAAFIRRHTGREYPAGPFVDEEGRVLGEHTGIIGYTVGQRRGLGVSSDAGRLYVKELRPAENTVVLSDNSSLFSRTLLADDLNLIACSRLDGPVRLAAKARYRMAPQPCTVRQTGEGALRVTFDQPQRAITPGQAVVLYDGDTVVGGATILKGEL